MLSQFLSVLGGYFHLLKVGLRKLLVVRSRKVAVPERLLYICSFNPVSEHSVTPQISRIERESILSYKL